MISKFNLSADELRYLAAHGADFGQFDFNHIPLKIVPESKDWFQIWETLLDAVVFRNIYNQRDVRLVDVFTAASEQDAEAAKKALTDWTGWDKKELDTLAGPNGLNLTLKSFSTGNKWIELHEAFQAMKRLGIAAEQFCALIRSDIGSQAKVLRQMIKARHKEEEWLKIARPLRDELREKQRSALVSFLVYTNSLDSPNDLFEILLIDVEMSPCMMTSRIKQAISSVQLFIQRCLMNLESKVELSRDDAEEWKWRKNYRVWEANRKVFLYPENWIEPELRDDKSLFFEELENDLLQNEITDEKVEKAFEKYLHKLDEVSRLEIAGMYEQKEEWFEPTDKKTKSYILHVFGRTRGLPHHTSPPWLTGRIGAVDQI